MAHRIGAPGQRVDFVMANAREFDARAVDIELPAFDLDLAKTDIALDSLQHFAFVCQFDYELIEVWLFGIPLERIGHARLKACRIDPRFDLPQFRFRNGMSGLFALGVVDSEN